MISSMILSREKAIILGTILGDSHIAVLKNGARLETGHSEKQKDYLFWKHKELQKWCNAKPHKISIYDKRYRKTYIQWRFKTRISPVFEEFYSLFYSRLGKKVIPKNFNSLLVSPLSLAVWFMDDGGRRNDSYGLFLNTLSFTKLENSILIDCLKKNFSLDARIHWVQDGYRIYIPSKYAKQFCELVHPYMIPSMYYKLSFDPVTTSFAQLDRARDRK